MVVSSSKVRYHHHLERDRLVDPVLFDVGLKEDTLQFRDGDGHLSICPSGQRSCTTDLKQPEGEELGVLPA